MHWCCWQSGWAAATERPSRRNNEERGKKIDTYGDSEQLHGHKVTLCKVWTEQYTDIYSHDHRPSINQLEIWLRTDAGNVVEGRPLDVYACAPPNKRKTTRDMKDERQFTIQNDRNVTRNRRLLMWCSGFTRNLDPWFSKNQRSRVLIIKQPTILHGLLVMHCYCLLCIYVLYCVLLVWFKNLH